MSQTMAQKFWWTILGTFKLNVLRKEDQKAPLGMPRRIPRQIFRATTWELLTATLPLALSQIFLKNWGVNNFTATLLLILRHGNWGVDSFTATLLLIVRHKNWDVSNLTAALLLTLCYEIWGVTNSCMMLSGPLCWMSFHIIHVGATCLGSGQLWHPHGMPRSTHSSAALCLSDHPCCQGPSPCGVSLSSPLSMTTHYLKINAMRRKVHKL